MPADDVGKSGQKTVIMQTYSAALLAALLVAVAGGTVSKVAQPAVWSEMISFDRFSGLGESAFINEYLDNAIPTITQFIVNHNLDPMPLPDLEEGFDYKPLLITYRGQLLLSNGHLKNLVSMRRSGDAAVSYFAHMLRFRIELGFRDLEFEYDYLAKLMDIGPTGGVRGSLDRIDVELDMLFDFNNDELHLQHFTLDHGRLSVRLTGNFLTDWLVSPVVAVFTRLFDDVIIRYVETTIRVIMQEQIEIFNATVKSIMESLY